MRNLGVMLVLSLALSIAGACGDDDDDGGGSRVDGGSGNGGRGGSSGRGGSGGKSGAGGSAGTTAGTGARGGSGGSGGTMADAGTMTISEAEIAGVLVTANSGEVQQGMIAQSRARRSDVRNYANMMVTMHGMALDKANALFMMIGLMPQQGPDAMALAKSSDTIVASLNSASASAFDAVYIESQVTVHETVLMLIDTKLLPSAKRAELRAELMSTRTVVESHLALAREIADALDQDAGADDGQR